MNRHSAEAVAATAAVRDRGKDRCPVQARASLEHRLQAVRRARCQDREQRLAQGRERTPRLALGVSARSSLRLGRRPRKAPNLARDGDVARDGRDKPKAKAREPGKVVPDRDSHQKAGRDKAVSGVAEMVERPATLRILPKLPRTVSDSEESVRVRRQAERLEGRQDLEVSKGLEMAAGRRQPRVGSSSPRPSNSQRMLCSLCGHTLAICKSFLA